MKVSVLTGVRQEAVKLETAEIKGKSYDGKSMRCPPSRLYRFTERTRKNIGHSNIKSYCTLFFFKLNGIWALITQGNFQKFMHFCFLVENK